MSKRKKIQETKEKHYKKVLVKKAENRSEDENPGSLDFGGIPDRNLKKNLGCG
ncbi:MAG TPA: hypothetical protein VEW65_06495 [Chryseolinea sp.]|nr:hypothetical protein [Chryseolinea sp.]